MPFAWANGGRILHDGICVFNSPQVLEALRFYKSLSKYSMLEKQDVLDQVFKSGQIGMMVSGAWNLKRIPQDAPELDFGVALMPRPERSKKVPASFGGGEMLVLLRGCRNKEASVRFIRFLAREDNALKLCREVGSVFPATRSAPKNPYYRKRPKEAVFIKQLTYAIHPPTHPLWVEIQEEINLAIEKALFGGDPQEVLRDCSLRIEKIIK
jgi:multiple sugar transport system substrate-binding protein